MKKENIKDTLKKYLINGYGISGEMKKIYQKLHSVMFANIDEYLEFLSQTNDQKMEILASRILLRISFHLPLAPTPSYLTNLLRFENSISNQSDEKRYVGRGHFVHLVNLYLLGLYVFFHHQSLRIHILHFLKTKFRKHFKTSNESFSLDLYSVQSFIRLWQLFVLYHDLGYPIEYYSIEKGSNNESDNHPYDANDENQAKSLAIEFDSLKKGVQINKFTDIFFDTKKSVISDACHMVLTKLYLGLKIVEYSNLVTFEDSVKYYIKDDTLYYKDGGGKLSSYKESKHVIKNINRNKYLLTKVYGSFALEVILNIFPKKCLTAVLRKKSDEIPVVIVSTTKDSPESHNVLFVEDKKTKLMANIQLVEDDAFNFRVPDEAYEWVYFIAKKDFVSAKEDILQSFFNKNPTNSAGKSDWSSFCFSLEALLGDQADFSFISDAKTFMSYAYDVYSVFRNYLSVDRVDEENTTRDILSEIPIIEEIIEEVPRTVLKVVDEDFQLLKRDGRFKNISNLFGVKQLVNTLLKNDIENKLRISHAVNGKLKYMFDDKATFVKDIFTSWHLVFEAISSSEAVMADENITNTGFSVSPLFDLLSENLKRNKLENTDFMMYKPPFLEGPQQDAFIDHGFFAGIIGLEIINIKTKIIFSKTKIGSQENVLEPKFVPIDRLKGNLLSNSTLFDIEFTYKCLVPDILFTVISHNIYPTGFLKNKNYKTDFNSNPFAYFAILCDSLQIWDRPILTDTTNRNFPHSTHGNKFNIKISNSIFHIFEEGDSLMIREADKRIRGKLDEYLKNASKIIRLSVAEL